MFARHKINNRLNTTKKVPNRCLFLIFFQLLILNLQSLSAQENILPSGGNLSSSSGEVNYSIGQIFSQNVSGSNGTVSEGVQQVFEIKVVSALPEAENYNLKVSAYPNPSINHLILEIQENLIETDLSYLLFDVSGKLISEGKINQKITNINTSGLISSTYFVSIFRYNQKIKSFKIIKK